MPNDTAESCMDHIVLQLSPDIQIRPEDFGGLLFHRPSLAIYALNNPAYELLSRLDGRHPRETTTVKLEGHTEFIRDLLARGWLREGERDG